MVWVKGGSRPSRWWMAPFHSDGTLGSSDVNMGSTAEGGGGVWVLGRVECTAGGVKIRREGEDSTKAISAWIAREREDSGNKEC